ncbi:DrmB family protein [Micromonospora aurantiaca]|uniref:DrmB family protein n=1 Tax=Micromonospora aurantiaca (nom. illeg.) TaxID=47850 RepID=UPI003798BE60
MTDDDAAQMIFESAQPLDPLADSEQSNVKNRAKVGSARPSSLLYTYGVGSIMDLPQFSIMPAGLDDWEPIWRRRPTVPTIEEPRLLKVVQLHLGSRVQQLRPFPWQPKARAMSQEGSDLGIPARVFPQWLRCTGCDYLGPLSRFSYTNTHPFRPDLATFEHASCPGRTFAGAAKGKAKAPAKGKTRRSPAVPARYLLACANGHLDEFPYALWVHRGRTCRAAPHPDLKLRDSNIGQGAGAVITCERCQQRRGMGEAQGEAGKRKLPTCRGRHPHLNAFDPKCGLDTSLMMMGASNLWFASTQSIIVMPRNEEQKQTALATKLRMHLTPEELADYAALPKVLRSLLVANKCDIAGVTDEQLTAAAVEALAPPPSEEERRERLRDWDPVELLVPEWDYLQKPSLFAQQQDSSGLMVTEMPTAADLPKQVHRVIAVNRMKKVNAVIGFTRIDEMDRVNDLASRLVKLTRDGRPTWVPATEDRGEGIFLQLDENAVAAWEAQILPTALWRAHREAHRHNFSRRFSATAAQIDPDTRFPAPRYWLIHTLAHILIRQMAMSCGYGAASLSERLYAWPATPDRPAAAGLLICTTASDSEGTLGGLVALSQPERLHGLLLDALRRAGRCSSDPVCGQRTPRHGEDFLHGAACHCCSFASETSCERANRFLDRRFLLTLPSIDDERVPGFFGTIDVY